MSIKRNKTRLLTCGFVNRFDMLGMLNRLARLKSSALRRAALGRAIVVLAMATTMSVAAASEINNGITDQKPFNQYNDMNLKLYLHNQIQDWDQFLCAVELAQRESSWNYKARNMRSGAYGLFQSMSGYADGWDPFEQIDKHVTYVDARYDGSWCKALRHLKGQGWH